MMSVLPHLRTADAQLQVHVLSATLGGFAWAQLIALAHVLTILFTTASSGSCYQQVLPLTASCVSVICGLMMIYAIGSPRGTTAFQTTPQGTCIILAALASLASIVMCLGVPNMSRRHRSRKPIPIKRMNMLGLVGSSEVCMCSCNMCSTTSAIWDPVISGLCRNMFCEAIT